MEIYWSNTRMHCMQYIHTRLPEHLHPPTYLPHAKHCLSVCSNVLLCFLLELAFLWVYVFTETLCEANMGMRLTRETQVYVQKLASTEMLHEHSTVAGYVPSQAQPSLRHWHKKWPKSVLCSGWLRITSRFLFFQGDVVLMFSSVCVAIQFCEVFLQAVVV